MTTYSRIQKAFREVPVEIGRFVRKQYPPFIMARSPSFNLNAVPVFMYHSVQAQPFERQLQFLQQNGYQTLSLESFIGFLNGHLTLKEPAVLLTFDDGDRSWFEVAFPLLHQYGMRATGFLVTAYITEESSDSPWLSWPQVKEMEMARVFSFASHTHRHERVFRSTRLVDFMHPRYDQTPLKLDTPFIQEQTGAFSHAPLGAPIYQHGSRMAVHNVFLDSPQVRQGCVDWVSHHGGIQCFEHANWRKQLWSHHQALCRQYGCGTFSSSTQAAEWVRQDLFAANSLLEQNLEHSVDHLCFPWGEGSDMAVHVARDLGCKSCFWVSTNRNENRAGDTPYCIPRIKDDYLMRLPGSDRHSILHVLHSKARRRRSSDYIY